VDVTQASDPRAGHRVGRGEAIGEGISWLSRWSARILLVALGAILIGLVVGELWSIAFPVFVGLVIATVFEPPVTWLRAHGWPSLLATVVVFVVFLAVIAGIVTALVPTVADQAPQIATAAGAGIEQVQQWLGGPPFNLGQTQIGQAVQAATDRLQQNATTIAGGVVTGITAVAGGVIDAVLALVLAFLFVKDGTRFLPWVTAVAGRNAGSHLEQVGRRCWRRLGGFIRSQAIIGFADAVFIGVGLVLFGVPLALPLAVLTFFGAFIPIVGALVAGILSVLIALVVKGPTIALFVLILILVVPQVEGNLLQPIVQGKGLGLHAAVVILAVTAGGSLAGIAGAFLSVPIAAVGAEIIRYLGEQIDERTGDEPPVERANRARREHERSLEDDSMLGDPSPEDGGPVHDASPDGSAPETAVAAGDDPTAGRRGR
jgi:putative heme transporter